MGNFKQRFGTWCSLNSVNAVDVICSTDLDFVIIDEEHSSVSFAGMENMVRACEARGKQAIIRSSNDDKQHLLRIFTMRARCFGEAFWIIKSVISLTTFSSCFSFTLHNSRARPIS